MVIKKNDKSYTVTEQKEYWMVSRKMNELSVEYKVSKNICASEDDLREYIVREELF